MKAIIREVLVKPSWSRKTVLTKTIIGRKDNITDKVNDYISERISKENLIKVKCFHVEVYNKYNKVTDRWEYKPTYR